MVDLLEDTKAEGFSLNSNGLPDYLPVLLEFFARIDAEEPGRLLGDAVHVIARIGNDCSKPTAATLCRADRGASPP